MENSLPTRIRLPSRTRTFCVVRAVFTLVGYAAIGAIVTIVFKLSVWPGVAAGALIGVILARKHLNPLSWPALYLSRDALYLVRRRKSAQVIPWEALSAVRPGGALVTLEFTRELEAPGAGMVSGLAVEANKVGMSAQSLADLLEEARRDPSKLTEDSLVRAQLTSA